MKLFRGRVWGFRWIDVGAFVVLIGLAVSVYWAKVGGGRDATEIASIEREITQESQKIRLLKADVAHAEQPARIQRLSNEFLQLAPASVKHEIAPDALVDAARGVAKP
ncbi:hypothetical protein BH11PSE2_BH11PSE2_12110 [soil metagenome]